MRPIKAIAGAVAMLVISMTTAFADAELNISSTGLALRGIDLVSYTSETAPIPGDFKIAAVHEGAIYRFAAEENKAAFTANPEKVSAVICWILHHERKDGQEAR